MHLFHQQTTEHLRALQVGVCMRLAQRRLDALAEQVSQTRDFSWYAESVIPVAVLQ